MLDRKQKERKKKLGRKNSEEFRLRLERKRRLKEQGTDWDLQEEKKAGKTLWNEEEMEKKE